MKKFSLLIALCMLLTIGGVYATWTYSGSQIDPQTEPFVSKMGALDHQGNSGSYAFSNNSVDFAIEPTTQEDKETSLVWGDGSMTLTFTAKGDITDDDLARALNATIVVEQASATLGTYAGSAIYKVNADHKVVLAADKWTDNGNDTYTYTITKTDLEGSISVNTFHLPTEDEYTAFKDAIQDVKFRVKITPAA